MPRLSPSSSPQNVVVVLGTCNGEAYLREFFASLSGQSYTSWRLVVRDDASTDLTPSLVAEMAAQDDRVLVMPGSRRREGPAKNFATLLQFAYELGAEHVFLADQDDVWLPRKIGKQMALMRATETSVSAGTPVLVYSNLTIVDRELHETGRAFFGRGGLWHNEREPLRTLLAHNFVPGCVSVMNRALLELSLPLPSSALMHDWWIALCAASAGRLAFLDEPAVLYRQHGENTVGASRLLDDCNPLRKRWRQRWKRRLFSFGRHIEQVQVLRRRLEQRLAGDGRVSPTLIDSFCRLFEPRNGRLQRLGQARRLGIPVTTPQQRLWFYARVLLARSASVRSASVRSASVRSASVRSGRGGEQGPMEHANSTTAVRRVA